MQIKVKALGHQKRPV